MSETRDHISIHIDNMLLGLPSSPFSPTIFRIDDYMESTKEKTHEPKVVSIGPIHHGKEHLEKMEQHKFRYLKLLLERQNENSVDKYIKEMRSIEKRARRCYADPIKLDPDGFVELLLLDGFFIIEFIRKYKFHELREDGDPIFKYDHILSQLVEDIMLVENQVPFFVLEQLFNMTNVGNLQRDGLISLTRCAIGEIHPLVNISKANKEIPVDSVDHLLDLIYRTWCSSFSNHLTATPRSIIKLDINSAVELCDAGIKFRKDARENFLEIKFDKGAMIIPTIIVSDGTESILRNLIMHEHFLSDGTCPKYVTDYAFFLHCLINSSKDVEVLRHAGILTNMLGDDDMVYHMLKRLGRNISVSDIFTYTDVFNKVNAHCDRRYNKWMANLRHNYFSSPWAYISFLAAVLLLAFTLTQTVFTGLSYLVKRT